MFDTILTIANSDERIRAVYMNGSRANPRVPKDKYQDYDIVFVVTETASFIANPHWVENFGEIAIFQEPDWNDAQTSLYGEPCDSSRRYAWLILFTDGNRIDLSIVIKEDAVQRFTEDKLTVLLLDKDGCLPAIPPPTDEDYWVKKPNQNQYTAYCNDFWWCLNNVAKGIARDELPYAMEMYHVYVRQMLNGMVAWYIGTLTDFSVSAGKMGKYYKKYLPSALYTQYVNTYTDGDFDHFWSAIFTACELFGTVALSVGQYFSFHYRQSEQDNTIDYLNKVKNDSTLQKPPLL